MQAAQLTLPLGPDGVKGPGPPRNSRAEKAETAVPGGLSKQPAGHVGCRGTRAAQPFFPSQASTFPRLPSTHFFAASCGDILSCAMYFATRFWSSFDQLKFFTSW